MQTGTNQDKHNTFRVNVKQSYKFNVYIVMF